MLVIVFTILLEWAARIAAAVVPPSNGIIQTGFLNNITSATKLRDIDPRFTTTYRQGQGRLSATSCLMNAANAMMELALESFTEPIRVRNYMDPWYPEVMIVPMAPGQRTEARYMLWGVWEGIRWMIRHHSFLDLVIGAYWDGILMCNIWIKDTLRQSNITGSHGTLGLTGRPEDMSTHNATVELTRGLGVDARYPLNDWNVTVSVTHVGGTLGITEVFIAIFAALEYMAHFPSTDEVARFQVFPEDRDTTIGILEHTRAPVFRPPYLEYQWAILGIGQIPGYMLQQMKFTEIIIEIAVNDVPLGEGFLSKDDVFF